jgi:hypothetical protein
MRQAVNAKRVPNEGGGKKKRLNLEIHEYQ